MLRKAVPLIGLAALIGSAPLLAAPPDREDRLSGASAAGKPATLVDRPASSRDSDDDDERQGPDSAIVVTARRMDAARTRIDETLGATVYTLTNDTIEDRPGGETRSIADVLLQTPSVRSEGGGRTLVRGSGVVQYRLNNIILPDGIADVGERISARLAASTQLITGALPAQYGSAAGGVVSITTKSGLYDGGGQAELYGGSHATVEPALEWAGASGGTSLFASGSFRRSKSAIAPTPGSTASQRSREIEGFAFADHVIDAENRASLILGSSGERSLISGAAMGPGEALTSDRYGIASFQHSTSRLDLQASAFAAWSRASVRFAQANLASRRTFGSQIEAAYEVDGGHVVRAGLLLTEAHQRESERAATRDSRRSSAAAFIEDEWKLNPSVTIDTGLRAEWLGSGGDASVEPRASLVWKSGSGLTAHAGYALYRVAPPLGESIPADRLRNERDDYVDVGAQQALGDLTLAIDAYWRSERDPIAERELPSSPSGEAFNFRRGRIRGVELSVTYAEGPVSAWSNLAIARADARSIATRRQLFSPAALAYADSHRVPLGEDQRATASAGASWRIGRLLLSSDLLAGSGARRTDDPARPNAAHVKAYASVGLAAVYRLKLLDRPTDLRIDLVNLFDDHYILSDLSRLEGGWTRYGDRRGIFVGFEQGF